MEFLRQHIEALIFASPQPVPVADIKAVVEEAFQVEVTEADILTAIQSIREQFTADVFSFELIEIAGGWQFLTKGAYHNSVALYLKQNTRKRLSQAALETLAIIAYRQPISKPDIERIRGVNCDYTIQKLLEKELIAIIGRSEEVGKPLLYGVSTFFMNYFGINSVNDLPKLKDLEQPTDNVIGSPSDN